MDERYGPETYGDRIAAVYDDFYGFPGETDVLVEGLAALAGPGPILELGIGTGRVALPLVARGLDVHGVDASEEMMARLCVKPGGAFVPDLSRYTRGQAVEATQVGIGHVVVDASRHDPIEQRIECAHLVFEGGVRIYPVQLRYAWPSELDLMARLAGLELEERRGGWSGEPFTAASGQHVSVYRKGP